VRCKQDSRAAARKLRNAAAVVFRLRFTNDIRYKFKSSQASKARLSSFKDISELCMSLMRCSVQPWYMGFHGTILTDVWQNQCPKPNTTFSF